MFVRNLSKNEILRRKTTTETKSLSYKEKKFTIALYDSHTQNECKNEFSARF